VNQELEIDVDRVFRDTRLPKHPTPSCCIKTLSTVRNLSINLVLLLPYTSIVNKHLTLIPLCLLAIGCTQAIPKPTATVSPQLQTVADRTISAESIETIARQITVQVHVGDRRGSGTMIAKRGNRYTVLTNAHVANKSNSYRITTPDGKTYQAQCAQPLKQGTCTADKNHDLALLEFTSTQNYTVPTWGDSRSLKPGETVYSAGFPFEGRELKWFASQITQQTSKPLQGGYQIGYSGTTAQGMSGGSLLNSSGQLIGIIGFNSQPILNDGYQYQDGTQPLPDVVKEWRKSSFAIPIATLARLDRQYQAFLPSGSSTVAYTGVVKQVDDIAAQITVRIEHKNGGNGSGVIIAKDGDTYYVATAAHVVQDVKKEHGRGVLGDKIAVALITPTQERVALSEGEINVANPDVDVAIVKFKSQQNYRVAEIGKYEFLKSDWVFVSGFPGKDRSKRRLLSIGGIHERETTEFAVKNKFSLTEGRNLVYTNLSLPGMSGGAILDRQGRLVGINTAAENQATTNQNDDAEEINFGYALGIPISTVIGFANQAQLPTTKLQIATTPGVESTKAETDEIQGIQLSALSKPSQTATAKEWLDYSNLLWRGGKNQEAVTGFDRAIKLLNSGAEIKERKDQLTIAYLGKGFALAHQGKKQEALTAFERAAQNDNASYPAWRYQGQYLGLLGRYQEALLAYQKAIQIDRSNTFTLNIEQVSYIFVPSGRGSEAIKFVDEAIRQKPNSLLPYWIRSSLYLGLQDFDKALADSNRAIEINPDFASAYSQRASIHFVKNDYDNALKDINKSISLDSKVAYSYTQRADIYEKRNQFDLALADYDLAIKLNPKDSSAYHKRGEFYQVRKDLAKAKTDFDEAIRLINPTSAIDYANRAHIYLSMKQEQKAIADFDEAIRLNPNNVSFYNSRAIANSKLGRDKEALQDFDKAIQINPENAEIYTSRGSLFAPNGNKHQEALDDLNKAIKINDKNSQAYALRGTFFYLQGKYQDASSDFKQAIEIDNNSLGYVGRGIIFNLQCDRQAALNDFNKAISIDPNAALAYIQKGQLQERTEDALVFFNQAIEIEPKNPENYAIVSNYFLLSNNIDKALEYLNKAIQIAPNDALNLVSRADLLNALGRQKEALNDINRAIAIDKKLARAYTVKGQILMSQKKTEEALNNYNIAIQLDNYLYAYWERAFVFHSQKKYQKTIDDFTKFIDSNKLENNCGFGISKIPQKKLIKAYLLRAKAYGLQGKYQNVFDDSDRAIKLDDKNAIAYILRGFANIKQNKYQEAFDDSDRAIKLNELSNELVVDDKASAYNNRGKALLFLNKVDSAIADFNMAITLNNKIPRHYLNLGLAYNQKQDLSQVKVNFTKAVELFRAQKDRVGEREAIAELQKLTK
jgi:tetratricopeptide (TPR) repeat protein/S1-C subfamily serine protease